MLRCEICGADILAKAGGIFVCTGCGMQYDKEKIQEMVAQCHQKPAEVETSVPMEKEPQTSSVAVPPQRKHNYSKILTGTGIAAVGLVALLMVLLPLRKKSEPTAVAPAETQAVFENFRYLFILKLQIDSAYFIFLSSIACVAVAPVCLFILAIHGWSG